MRYTADLFCKSAHRVAEFLNCSGGAYRLVPDLHQSITIIICVVAACASSTASDNADGPGISSSQAKFYVAWRVEKTEAHRG